MYMNHLNEPIQNESDFQILHLKENAKVVIGLIYVNFAQSHSNTSPIMLF